MDLIEVTTWVPHAQEKWDAHHRNEPLPPEHSLPLHMRVHRDAQNPYLPDDMPHVS
jgi:hypothetical protein